VDLTRTFIETQIILFACSMELDKFCLLDFSLDLFFKSFQ
jgi:hypothetical protein